MDLDSRLEAVAGQPMGFSLLIFQSVEGSRMNYVSNCDRDDVIQAMRSLLKGWEDGMPDIPGHKVT